MLPTLSETSRSRSFVETFGGLNQNLRCNEGEWENTENLTVANYPVLCTRPKRGIVCAIDQPQGLIAKDVLLYVDGTDVVYGEHRINLNLSQAESDCPKQIISMGAYAVIFPDKAYLNTKDLTDYGYLEASVTTDSEVSFSLCRVDGENYGDAPASGIAPESPSDGDLWIDTSGTSSVLKKYSESMSMWVGVATTYIRISATGIGTAFEQYDGVIISGCTATGTEDLNAANVIWDKGDD